VFVTEKSLKLYKHYKNKVTKYETLTGCELSPLDTIGVVCVDKTGDVVASCSSGGLALKHPGRVGQAGSYGAGVWAEKTDTDSSYCCCTSGCGEHLVRTTLAREVVDHVRSSDCPTSALHQVMKNKFLG
jgi:taspase (threonine aspartase 1)